MDTKLIEIRDKGTYIPVLCVKPGGTVSPFTESKIWQTSGYGNLREQAEYVLMYTIYDWDDRTRRTAHRYIIKNWDSLESGSVVDVEFILGETTPPKTSQNI